MVLPDDCCCGDLVAPPPTTSDAQEPGVRRENEERLQLPLLPNGIWKKVGFVFSLLDTPMSVYSIDSLHF